MDDAKSEKGADKIEESGKSFDNKFSSSNSPLQKSDKWEPPKPAGRLVDQKAASKFDPIGAQSKQGSSFDPLAAGRSGGSSFDPLAAGK